MESLTWRVVASDGKVYNIVSVQPDNKKQYMLLYCFLNSYDQMEDYPHGTAQNEESLP